MKHAFQMTFLGTIALLVIAAGVAVAHGGSHSPQSERVRQLKDLEETQIALTAYLNGKAEINDKGQDGAGDPLARGTATFFVVGSRTICYSFLVRGMEEPPVAVHIHRAPAGQNADPNPDIGVAIDFTKGVPKDATGKPSGNPGWSSGCKTVEGKERDALTRILSNPRGYYVNMHSAPSFPKGAIRGQLSRMLYDND